MTLAMLLLAGVLAQPVEPRVRGADAVAAYFTPGDDIAGLINARIAGAKSSVQVQAYLFTDWTMARALQAAARRGVKVEVIGDAQQYGNNGLPVLASLAKAGARVYLNASVAAAHDKVVIVDGATKAATVVTGSFNFTQAAQARNAENVVVISGRRALTDRFVRNFERHRAASSPLQ